MDSVCFWRQKSSAFMGKKPSNMTILPMINCVSRSDGQQQHARSTLLRWIIWMSKRRPFLNQGVLEERHDQRPSLLVKRFHQWPCGDRWRLSGRVARGRDFARRRLYGPADPDWR